MAECKYPDCNCPFDMGPDNKCFSDLNSTLPKPKASHTALLPCPFCGEEVETKYMPIDPAIPFCEGYWYIDHGTDGTDDEGVCKLNFTVMEDLDRLISVWNTRAV